ncbi:hypothetical protein [Embleya sp. NPDC001921]
MRTTWTTTQVRAVDLYNDDTVLIDGVWREVLDVWKNGDKPEHTFGEDSPTTAEIRARLDWTSVCWIAIRYVDEKRSTPCTIAHGIHVVRTRSLMTVQVPEPAKVLDGPLSVADPRALHTTLTAVLHHMLELGDDVHEVLTREQRAHLDALVTFFRPVTGAHPHP